MKQSSILLAGALISSLIFGAAAANEQHQRALQRQIDLNDKTPIGPADIKVMKRLIERGILHMETGASEIDQSEDFSESQTRRGLAKKAKNGRAAPKTAGKAEKRGGAKKNEARGGANTRQGTGQKRTAPKKKEATQRTGGQHHPPTKRTGQQHSQTQPADTKRWHDPVYNDDWYDDFFYYDDVVSPGDDHYVTDDYYGYGKGKGAKKGSKKGHKKGGHDHHDDYYYQDDHYYGGGKGKGKGSSNAGYDDDHYQDDLYYDDMVLNDDNSGFDDDYSGFDDDYFGGLPSYIPFSLGGFQDSRELQPFVPATTAMDEFAPGTRYLYSDEPVFAIIFDNNFNNTGAVDEADQIASVSGKCTRTDPFDVADFDYSGKAYCQFTYDLLNEFGGSSGQLTAEGPVQIGEIGVLPITGGTEFFRKTIGEVFLYPVDVSFSTPPTLQINPMLDLPASYQMDAILYMESSLLPPEMVF